MKYPLLLAAAIVAIAPVASAANARYDYFDGGSSARYDYYNGGSSTRYKYESYKSGGSGYVSIPTSVTHQSYDDPDNYTVKRVRAKHVGLPSGVYGRNRNLAIK